MTPYFIEGLVLGLGLFVAPGPKDTLVIRQAVSGGPLWILVAICVLADILLIAFGVTGLGSLLGSRPEVMALLLLSGAIYLLWFGAQRLRPVSVTNPCQTLKAAIRNVDCCARRWCSALPILTPGLIRLC